MSAPPADHRAYELQCPHCKRTFRAELLEGAAARYNGFKCAHCKLFVPLDRITGEAAPAG